MSDAVTDRATDSSPRTLVTFHAHPDDEAIATGGTMARAVADGHRVVLVVATRGELGEVAEGFLPDGESLGERRVTETCDAARVLGVSRVEFLGYRDSGMMDEGHKDDPEAFWQADVEEAAGRLASILEEEDADILTVYDDHGNYGHPDHIQVHRVGVRAAAMAGTPHVLEATMNRDHVRRLSAAAQASMEVELHEDELPEMPDPDEMDLGVDEALLTTAVDVTPFIYVKREAMRSHASQIGPDSFFLQMPDEAFASAFGIEWYIRRGVAPGLRETDVFDPVPDT